MVKYHSPSYPNKFTSFQGFAQGNETFLLSKVTTEHKKTAEGMDMLSYCQALSNEVRNDILENLRQDKDKEDYV